MNQYYGYYYDQSLSELLSFMKIYWLIGLAFGIFMIIVRWKILNKADRGGWEQFIPFYNSYIEYALYWKPLYFWILLFTPLIAVIYLFSENVFTKILLVIAVIATLISPSVLQFKKAKAFGQSGWFGLGLLFFNPIFLIVLAFSNKCVYRKQ